MTDLALFGGKAVRTVPFSSPAVIDENERRFVNSVLDSGEFSRFIGSPDEDIDKVLLMPSKEATTYKKQYFTFLGGKVVREFERDFAEFIGADYGISVNSATSGLSVALGAAGIGPGDEVITTCMSFNATATSIFVFNAIPVFVDVSSDNFCLDPERVEQAITKSTKAILVVHLLGFPAEMSAILDIAKKHKLVVIEDCAQAPGTLYDNMPVGTLGDMGIFSFQETKNIMTGEGGMIVTNNSKFARLCRLIRNHGESIPDDTWKDQELVNIVGMNFRMTELTAALGVAQLKKLDENNRIRKENTLYLQKALKEIYGLQIVPFPKGSVPHSLPIIYDENLTGVARVEILRALRSEGIPVGGGYMRLMPANPIFQRNIAYGPGHCPWSCHLYDGASDYDLDQYPVARELTEQKFIWFYHINAPNTIKDMDDVVSAFHKVFSKLDSIKNQNLNDVKLQYKW